jgi:hypothetical protein
MESAGSARRQISSSMAGAEFEKELSCRTLLERLRRDERSDEVKSLVDADCGGEIRVK